MTSVAPPIAAPLAPERSHPPSPLAPAEAAFAEAIPWPVWVAVLAVTSTVIGVQWDIAWHRSVGRDTFWSPPHMAIYLGGVLAPLAAGYQIMWTTFARSAAAVAGRAAAVRIWGFSGPLGAFISAWGGVAMLASAPFDDWWHNAYGLDVKILSPPHTVLALGIFALQLGALILIIGLRNRATGSLRSLLTGLFVYVGAFLLVVLMTFEMEYTHRVHQHSGTFYRAVMMVAPLVLLGLGRASGHRFGATLVAAGYSAIMLTLLWVFPLVPATPKLGPVFYQVTHLVPAGFPLLLVVPALVVDLVSPRLASRSLWQQAAILGLLLFAVFFAVQWPMGSFLSTPYARNWFFGAHYFGYNARPSSSELLYTFHDRDGSRAMFWRQLMIGAVVAVITSRLGIGLANWLRGLRR